MTFTKKWIDEFLPGILKEEEDAGPLTRTYIGAFTKWSTPDPRFTLATNTDNANIWAHHDGTRIKIEHRLNGQLTQLIHLKTTDPVEFDLLVSLAKARGRVKSREALLDEIRDRNYDVFDRSIDVHISALRRKLGDDARQPRFIRTLRSAGYMLVDPASPLG